ncbi:MAG: ATP-dependent nuclease [Nocardioides sp.]
MAFLGPNEAGKTSVLHALTWLDQSGSALPDAWASRGNDYGKRRDDDKVVSATYRLEASDWERLEGLAFARTRASYTYTLWKKRNGGQVHQLTPRLLRDPRPFENALSALKKAPKALESRLKAARQAHDNDEVELDVNALHHRAVKLLGTPDVNADDSSISELKSYASWLAEQDTVPSLARAASSLQAVAEVLSVEHPHGVALSVLDEGRPLFREFAAEDRELPNEVDTNEDASAIPRPFSRVLDMAETSLVKLKEIWNDEGLRDTTLEACNERLAKIFQRAWSQSDLTVRLKAEHHLLKIQVKVVNEGVSYYSTFGERSDGLKSFVALVGFLNSLADAVPPILLIDEAETHLHLDAQADLIQVLQDEVQATQVFYTTHSPGCLPLDLGRGLRFVEPSQTSPYSSEVNHNFWDSRYPGFSAVLFKMGAAAFAFSALRRAVLAEGPTDMILLPTLLRSATGLDRLSYQVAPHLNNLNESEVRLDEAAASVAYLTDGDQGGRDARKNLTRRRGVPRELVLQHPSGFAVEDYVDPSLVIHVVNELRQDPQRDEQLLSLGALPDGETIGQRLDKWFRHRKLQAPGTLAIATRLVNLDEPPRLKTGAKAKLQKLHEQISAALNHRSENE